MKRKFSRTHTEWTRFLFTDIILFFFSLFILSNRPVDEGQLEFNGRWFFLRIFFLLFSSSFTWTGLGWFRFVGGTLYFSGQTVRRNSQNYFTCHNETCFKMATTHMYDRFSYGCEYRICVWNMRLDVCVRFQWFLKCEFCVWIWVNGKFCCVTWNGRNIDGSRSVACRCSW